MSGLSLYDVLTGVSTPLDVDEVRVTTPAGDQLAVRLLEDGTLRIVNLGQRAAGGLSVQPVAANVVTVAASEYPS